MHVGQLLLPDFIVSGDRLDDIPDLLVTYRDANVVFLGSGVSGVLSLSEHTGEFEPDCPQAAQNGKPILPVNHSGR